MKICIFGASGFVGRALTERLLRRKDIEIKAVIHLPGNSWSLLRLGIPIFQADQSRQEEIEQAINGCTHVVNCSLGPFDSMLPCLDNLIQVCIRKKIKRLVHISSITVYGERPSILSETENGPPLAVKKSYGWYKYKQDLLIKKANNSGLSSIVLCPPHVTGAYGRIFLQVLDGIRKGSFALVDNGKYPCNIVDINNLCHAIELSLVASESDGERIFITNGDNFTWGDLANSLAPLAGKNPLEIRRITSAQAESISNNNISILEFISRIIKKPEVRLLLPKTIFGKNIILNTILRHFVFLVKYYSSKVIVNNVDSVEDISNLSTLDPWLCTQQLRGVRHSISKAQQSIGYKPNLDSFDSISIFKDFYKTLYGFETTHWKLYQELLD
jgi:2-alkyl-3-oxoalkanoate reductase